MKHIKPLLFLAILFACIQTKASEFSSISECLQKYSMKFETAGKDYYNSGFIGNGILGATIYNNVDDSLCWELGRVDVVDNRKGSYPLLYKKARLPIGKFHLPLKGGNSSLLIDFQKSEVSGNVKGSTQGFTWRTLTPHSHNVYIIELNGTDLPEITFRPEVSVSPRFIWRNNYYQERDDLKDYGPNPTPVVFNKNKYSVCKQSLIDGGEYSTAWTTINKKGRKILIASVAYSPETNNTDEEAINNIEKYLQDGEKKAEKMHRDWWMDFYSRSYIHVGEDRYDQFFWSQLYKLGSATRADGYIIDLMGPWYHNDTPWPAIWWNLNIQLTYSPVYAINHSDLALPLLNMLDKNVDNLIRNVNNKDFPAAAIGRASSYDCRRGAENEHGLLTWTLFYYWKYCTYTNDTQRLKEKFFPLLKLAVNYYRTLLFEGEDGKWHMPLSHSPEYADAEDCNFELAILRWGCQTLIDIDKEYAMNDELSPIWDDIMNRLTDYPMDEDGFLIGKGVKLKEGHRHYSHLLMLYPLGLLDLNEPDNAQLARKSIEYWLGFKTKAYYVGYTYTGASSVCTLMEDGERAYNYLNVFFDKYMQPNTFYRESGPVFETPMSALASYTEMLLNTKRGEIRIMPAVPGVWKDIRYEKLLADGGYEVSATRKDGKLRQATIKSLYGGKCRIYLHLKESERKVNVSPNLIIATTDEYIEILFSEGQEVKIENI